MELEEGAEDVTLTIQSKFQETQRKNRAYLQELQLKNQAKAEGELRKQLESQNQRLILKDKVLKEIKTTQHKLETDNSEPKLRKKAFVINKGQGEKHKRDESDLNLSRMRKARSKTTSNMKDLRHTYGLGPKLPEVPRKFTRLPSLAVGRKPAPKSEDEVQHSATQAPRKMLTHGELLKSSSPTPAQPGAVLSQEISDGEGDIAKSHVGNSIIKRNIDLLQPSKPRSFQYISDVEDWIKKNRLPEATKVFIVNSAYPEIKRALLNRGWVENPEYSSSCFHFKFALKSREVDPGSLQPYQMTNHFERAAAITTKSGLCKSLLNCVWSSGVDPDSFFPKCFESFEESEFFAFQHYYKLVRAECILKKVLVLAGQGLRESPEYTQLVSSPQLKAALSVCKRRLLTLDEMVDQKGTFAEISEEEWNIISLDEKTEEDLSQMIREKNAKRYANNQVKSATKKKRRVTAKKKTNPTTVSEQVLKSVDFEHYYGADGSEESSEEESQGVPPTELDEKQGATVVKAPKEAKRSQSERPALEKEMVVILNQLQERYPQTLINGHQNIWIVKPAGLSRGRGIRVFNSLAEITMAVKSKDLGFVIQKYMENPLLYKNRKLDIRQWVLVTDWNPLCVWFYSECYIRLCASEYDPSNRFSLTFKLVERAEIS